MQQRLLLLNKVKAGGWQRHSEERSVVVHVMAWRVGYSTQGRMLRFESYPPNEKDIDVMREEAK